MSKLCWRPIREGTIDAKSLYMPAKRRKPIDLSLQFDLFKLKRELIDVVLAVVTSAGHTRFFYETECIKQRERYFEDLRLRGIRAAKSYEDRMRSQFQKYKYEFREGYSLPEPPTPEIRAIYDAAAIWENRPTNPCGTTLHSGFSLGEYHWRSWPLSNLIDENDSSVPR